MLSVSAIWSIYLHDISCKFGVRISNHIDLATVGRVVVTKHCDKFVNLEDDWVHLSVISNSKWMSYVKYHL